MDFEFTVFSIPQSGPSSNWIITTQACPWQRSFGEIPREGFAWMLKPLKLDAGVKSDNGPAFDESRYFVLVE